MVPPTPSDGRSAWLGACSVVRRQPETRRTGWAEARSRVIALRSTREQPGVAPWLRRLAALACSRVLSLSGNVVASSSTRDRSGLERGQALASRCRTPSLTPEAGSCSGLLAHRIQSRSDVRRAFDPRLPAACGHGGGRIPCAGTLRPRRRGTALPAGRRLPWSAPMEAASWSSVWRSSPPCVRGPSA